MNPEKQKMVYANLNLRPDYLAAGWVEQGLYPENGVWMQPAEGVRGEQHREILDLCPAGKDDGAIIRTKSKSELRILLEKESAPDTQVGQLLPVLDRELSFFRLALALRERDYLLGLPPKLPDFFPEIRHWEADQRAVLAFFLPFRQMIRRDLALAERGLRTALRQRVSIARSAPAERRETGAAVDRCTLDAAVKVGGRFSSPLPCLIITVGPLERSALTDFAPGGRQRRFLEEGLLPALLPPDCDWRVVITVVDEVAGLRVADKELPALLEVNTEVG